VIVDQHRPVKQVAAVHDAVADSDDTRQIVMP